MKIKTKLTLGVGLLFVLIVLVSAVGVKYVNELKSDTENILVANYHSLEYGRNMLLALEERDSRSFEDFEANLRSQEKNLTEKGEPEITAKIRSSFELLSLNRGDSAIPILIRKDIFELMDMNMQSIQRKSEVAKVTAENAVSWISITGTLCFLIAFILLVNLPSSIANPIKELTESIEQIAKENYSERVHFESNSEFGQLARSFNVMAEKLEEFNDSNLARLMMEKRRIETLINNMHDPVFGLDENHNIIFINNEALKISGLKKEQVSGKSAQEIAVYNDLMRSLIQDVLKPKESDSKGQQPLKIFADNKESFFEKEIIPISVIPTAEEQAKHIGDVIILQNITPFKELDSAKTNFIATISHELKTPISSILMSLELLQNEKIGIVNSEQKQLIQSVKDDSGRLLKITGELLNMTQVETGKIQLNLAPASPLDIIQYASEAVKTLAEQKLVSIEIDCSNKIAAVVADMDKSAWVLTNLLANAIQYSHENSKVLLAVKEIDKKVVFSIRDFGKGIDPKHLDKIFDRYFQIPGSSKSGTGLGLAICKEFIEAQGGSISVESDLGAGSVFSFLLNASNVGSETTG